MAEQQGNYPQRMQTLAGQGWIILDQNSSYMRGSNTTYITYENYPYVGVVPDPTFAQDDLYNNQNKQFANYYYKVNENGEGITFYDATTGDLVENVSIDTQYLTRSVALGGYGYHDVYILRRQLYFKYDRNMNVTECGYALEFYGFDSNEEAHTGVLYRPIQTTDIINSLLNDDRTHTDQAPGYTGETIATLSGTAGFVLSQFPSEFYSKSSYSQEHNKWSDVVCVFDSDAEDAEDAYTANAAWRHRYATYDAWVDKSNVQIATAMSEKCGGLGSDLFRKLSNGQYYNGVDLESANCIWSIYNPEIIIPFKNGFIKMAGTNGYISQKYIAILDKNNQEIDRFYLPIPSSGGSAGLPAGFANINNDNLCALYLAEKGGEYHLFGLIQFYSLYDDSGVQIKPGGGDAIQAFFLSHLYKFNENATELLENGTVITSNGDIKQLPESSPGASFPGSGSNPMIGPNGEILPENNPDNPYDPDDPNKPKSDDENPNNMHNMYDTNTEWPDQPPISDENPNGGIRYNGNTIINGGDIENNTTVNIPGGHQPNEDISTPDSIPTPINSGMLNILAPTNQEMIAFGQDLNSTTFLQAITNYFSNPMDIVISAHTCIAPNLITAGSAKHLVYGVWESAYTMTALSQMYYKVDMGSVNLPEQTNSFADYPPVSNYSIYLPFIGTRDIPGKICVGRTLNLNYYINVLTGDILAELMYHDNLSGNEFPVNYYNGNTLARFPLKSTDYSSIINGAISGVFTTASAIGQIATGNIAGGILTGVSGLMSNASHGLHPDINVTGTVAGSLTYTMYDSAYVIQRSPHFYNKLPFGYNHLHGKPSVTGGNIATVTNGNSEFVSFNEIDLTGLGNATQDEKNEIIRMLKQGVYTR